MLNHTERIPFICSTKTNHMKQFLLLATLFISHLTWATSIEVIGFLRTDTTWNVDTVFLKGPLWVRDKATLTIMDGVRIIADESGQIELQDASLICNGALKGVTFQSSEKGKYWEGIKVYKGPAIVKITNTSILSAEYGFFGSSDTEFEMDNSQVMDSKKTAIAMAGNNSNYTVTESTFSGGEMGISTTSSSSTSFSVVNCEIKNFLRLGGVRALGATGDFIGCVIHQNNNETNGGGMYISGGGKINVTNCTIAGNNSEQNGGGIWGQNVNLNLVNTLIWGNTSFVDNQNCHFLGNAMLNCDIDEDETKFIAKSKKDNMREDPKFKDLNTGDFVLLETSPCINMGRASTIGLNLPDKDLAGEDRIKDGIVDIGAYEVKGIPVSTNKATTESSFSVYPNPTTDFIMIDLDGSDSQAAVCQLLNIQGQVVVNQSVSQNKRIDLRELPRGHYSIRILSSAGNTAERLVIKN